MIYASGDFRVDATRQMLWRGDQPVRLQPKAFQLLLLSLSNPGRVVEKTEIMRPPWPDTFAVKSNIT